MEKVIIRKAIGEDAPLILDFIKRLSEYEKLPNEVTASIDILFQSLFLEKRAEVIFVVENGKEVGFALYFYNFSTFTGKKGLYLEDVFILEEYRGKGYGKKLLSYLAKIALENDCSRFEWIVLDWNTPSINFYKSLGAFPLNDWTLFRLQKEKLKELADKSNV